MAKKKILLLSKLTKNITSGIKILQKRIQIYKLNVKQLNYQEAISNLKNIKDEELISLNNDIKNLISFLETEK